MTADGAIGELAWLVAENQPCVALTGAGASTDVHDWAPRNSSLPTGGYE